MAVPMVEVELISNEEPGPGLADLLADQIGLALQAAEGSTWVRLRVVRRDHYGESGGPLGDSVKPVFVTITSRHQPAREQFAEVVEQITSAVARATGHPRQNVHVIFAPDAAGRVAFGGHVVE
jgi:phenylpyruvate tautomerase PptA (4-oxalocrotonate tautomerase family)